jgi:AbiV family abortive infection protein
MTSIYKLKKVEYKDGSKLAYENFKDLLSIAELSATKERYGIASSLCILSVEELTKSVILGLLAINNDIPFLNLEGYFKSHDFKQSTLYDFTSNLNSLDDDQNANNDVDGFKGAIFALFAIVALIVWIYENKEQVTTTKKRVSIFNEIKESGFYIGYNSTERSWQSPKTDFNQEFYESIFKMTNEIAELLDNWIFSGKLEDSELFDLLESLDDSVVDKARLKKLKMES